MKRMPALLALLVAAPLMAETLTVNVPSTKAYEGDATLALSQEVAVQRGETAVLEATLTMSLPSEPLTPADAAGDRFAIAADSDGLLKVFDGMDWEPLNITGDKLFAVEEGDQVLVKVAACWAKEEKQDAAAYEVYAKNLRTGTEVANVFSTGLESASAIQEALTFKEVALEGEGSATAVSMTHVPRGIVPPTANSPTGEGGQTQDPELLAKYVGWLNAPSKGGAMGAASDAEKSDAFAMNVGGKPALAVTAVEPQADGAVKITVKGSYEKDGAVKEASLKTISGTLYISYSETLSGPAKTETFDVALAEDGTATVLVPAGKKARFLRARVALAKPEDTL